MVCWKLSCFVWYTLPTSHLNRKEKNPIAILFMFRMIGRNCLHFSYKTYTAPTKYFTCINWPAIDFDQTLDIQIFLN